MLAQLRRSLRSLEKELKSDNLIARAPTDSCFVCLICRKSVFPLVFMSLAYIQKNVYSDMVESTICFFGKNKKSEA